MSNKIIIFIPSIEKGGVEKNLFIVSNYLKKYFKNITLITSGTKYKKNLKKIKITSPFINVEDYKSRRLKYFFCIITLFFNLFNSNNKTLVISFQLNLLAILIAKLLRKKIIIRANSSPNHWSKGTIKTFFFTKIFNLSDGIIVNSEDFRINFNKKFKVKSKCIYNPLDANIIKKKSTKYIKNQFNRKNVKLINIGRFVDQKDQITILKSLNLIINKFKRVNYELIIMGRGLLKNNLKKFILKKNLSKNVKIIDYQSNPYPFIKQADIFILSSKYEGLPNVLLEAATLKKYIISSDCPSGPREILSNGKGGDLYKVGDFKKLSKLIMNFSHHNSKRKIKFCYKNLNRYDYQRNLQEYLNFVNLVINSK